jgi:hypothetical protein
MPAVRWRTDPRGARAEDRGMKPPRRKSFSDLYAEWLQAGWALFTTSPVAEPSPKAAQVTADQEWEDEGGSIRTAKKPGIAQGPKIPL